LSRLKPIFIEKSATRLLYFCRANAIGGCEPESRAVFPQDSLEAANGLLADRRVFV
jgi:predicted Abi (CAAX) family protease